MPPEARAQLASVLDALREAKYVRELAIPKAADSV